MAEDWEISRLDRKCPSQVGNVYNKPVSKTGWQVFQDNTVTV